MFFSKSTNDMRQTMIKDLLGVSIIQHYEKYLALPSLVGRKKKGRASPILNNRFGRNCKDGRISFYHKQGEKFLSKQWLKLFPLIL